MPSCFLMRSRSVVPPMPSEVSSDMAEPERSSTPISGKAATILGSSMRMVRCVLRSEQNHKLVAGAADVACSDRQDGVARTGLAQQEFDAFLHRAKVEHFLVPRLANRFGECLAGYSGDGCFAGGVNVGQDQNVGEIEGDAEVVPQMLACG